MLQNAYFLAKIGADTAENEQHFARFGLARAVAGARGAHQPATSASGARGAAGG